MRCIAAISLGALATLLASAPLCIGQSAAQLRSAERRSADAISFLEKRVADDPQDFVALNQLATRYLQRARETGRLEWQDRADRTVAASLAALPAESNPGALQLRGLCDLAFHRFEAAMNAGIELIKAQSDKSAPYLLLGDALFELGDLPGAEWAWTETGKLAGDDLAVTARLARISQAWGLTEAARKQFDAAIESTRKAASTDKEALAWLHVRRGEMEFKLGEWDAAERFYNKALAAVPGYWAAQDHIAELRAAQGHWNAAQDLAREVAQRTERPELFQAFGDIAAATGRTELAREWRTKAERAYLTACESGDMRWMHHLAGFYADSLEKPEEAVRWARKDLEHRSTAAAHDALAWALFKAGDVDGANEEATRALSWNLADSHLLYHAGMIRLAAGKVAEGRELLDRSAAINPREQSFHFHR